MLSLREVCDKYGTYRQEMQRLAKVGLVEPTLIDEKGYWFYDEMALGMLFIVQIYRELGYNTKEIKELFDTGFKFQSERSRLVAELRNKKRIIDGQIKYLQSLSLEDDLSKNKWIPEEVKQTEMENEEYPRISPRDLMNRYSALECRHHYGKKRIKDVDLGIVCEVACCVIPSLALISTLKKYSPNSKETQECINNIKEDFPSILDGIQRSEYCNLDTVMINVLLYVCGMSDVTISSNTITFFVKESFVFDEVELLYGEGTRNYIAEALIYHTIPQVKSIVFEADKIIVQRR